MDRSLAFIFFTIAGIQLFFFIIAASFRTDKVTDLAYGATFILLAIWGYIQIQQSVSHLLLAVIVILWGLRLVSYLEFIKTSATRNLYVISNKLKIFKTK